MRIVVHGQQAFGKAVLEALLKRGENVVAVYVAPEKEGAKADPLKEAAIAAKLPIYQPASYKDPKVWEEFKALKPDLQVMAFVTLFVPEEFLNIPTHGSIQYHPSLLPAYRGASAINWPIIKGEKETGLSIFWPDNGLDTGAVLVQKKTPISGTDTLGTVYFDRLFPMGVEAMMEVGRPGEGRQGAAHQAGRGKGNLRRPVRPRQCQDRLGQALGADRSPDPRLQSGARRMDHARRQDAEDLRRQAAAGERSERDRRQARRSGRGRCRRHSPSFAPTAVSRSPAFSPTEARRSTPRARIRHLALPSSPPRRAARLISLIFSSN